MQREELYAGVIVDVRAEAVDRIFQYSIPDKLAGKLELGHRVLVPFGHRRVEGYVVEFSGELEISADRLKSIIRLLDEEPIILPAQMELARWLRNHYVGLLSEALQFMLPPGNRYGKERVGFKQQQMVTLVNPDVELRANATAQRRMLEILLDKGRILASELVKKARASYSSLESLAKLGAVQIEDKVLERKVAWEPVSDPTLVLTEEQTAALREINKERKGSRRPVLLHGVTGSGKTEIYLQAIAEVIKEGRQAIVLVPEIALTPQMLSRFGARFGDRISVLHSALSLGERFDQWWKIYNGDVSVVIGARSAVFAPTPNLGLIVVDEEHEGTYKQEQGSIRYVTRDVAEKRCELTGAQLILGSATPSLESYHRALKGEYNLVQLTKRVEERPLPAVELVDMRREFEEGNRTMLSGALREAIAGLAGTENQAIILINRRGYSTFVLCRECGHVMECPNCSVSLTWHRSDNRLHCHYCLHREVLPPNCPRCASRYLRQFGVGSEQVQSVLNEEFPELRTVRLDSDTTRRKGAHQRILKEFASGRAQILIGTQMVAKGLDFPNVTLVGVLSADLALNFPDIRASERTFQLLTQVAGRSGRGDLPGRVIVQVYEPNHFAVQCAQRHDYTGFYRQEISFRRKLNYPPFSQLIRILCSGPAEETKEAALTIERFLLSRGVSRDNILGPAPAPIGRLKGRYRWQLVLKSEESLSELLHELPAVDPEVRVIVDIDPLFLM